MIEPVALELPLSGLTVQWRATPPGWRLGSPAELTALDAQPEGHRGWATMTGGTRPFAHTQRPPDARDTDPTPLWCVVCWENPGHSIVMGADGGSVPIAPVGGLLVGEFVSTHPQVTLRWASHHPMPRVTVEPIPCPTPPPPPRPFAWADERAAPWQQGFLIGLAQLLQRLEDDGEVTNSTVELDGDTCTLTFALPGHDQDQWGYRIVDLPTFRSGFGPTPPSPHKLAGYAWINLWPPPRWNPDTAIDGVMWFGPGRPTT